MKRPWDGMNHNTFAKKMSILYHARLFPSTHSRITDIYQ